MSAGAAASASAARSARSAQAQAKSHAESYAATYPDMLLAHVTGTLNELAARWEVQREQIRSAAEVEARNRYVREKFKEMIHGFLERNPLTPRTTAVHERDGYRIENVLFQSQPDFWVSASLYVPRIGNGPFPAVISPCGHYPLARMYPEYQCAYIDLVKSGFVVLAYDPIGQGERRQYWNPDTDAPDASPASIFEHSMAGHLLLLIGEDLTHYRVWDGMRAIDYLETRPEVDWQRIGCAGHSGGGTLALFISALDDRVKCAVVNEGGTSSRWPVHMRGQGRVGPADVEQNYFPGARYGVDMPDLHIAIAPRPLLATVEEYHQGFNRAAEQIRGRYAQLGVADRFATEAANDPHAWTPKLRLATTRWLSRWLMKASISEGGPDRAEAAIEQPATLYCTPNGSLLYSGVGDTIFSLIAKKQKSLPVRRELTGTELTGELKSLLRYQQPDGPLAPRTMVVTPRKGYAVEKLEFLSEPGIYIPVWIFVPEKKTARYPTWLMFNDAGKQADGLEFGLYERMARNGQMVIACDVRGIGETKPPHTPAGDWPPEYRHLFDVETAIVYMAWYADQSLLGMRVQDVVRSVTYALSRGDIDKERFRVAGKGAGALWVMFAAVMDNRISDMVLERGLLSYSTLARSDRYVQSTGVMVPDILKHFDLPQIAAGLAGRKLTLAGPVDHMKHAVELDTARRTYAATEAAFTRTGGIFKIVDNSGGLYESA